jgi:hypothetical protein
MRRGQVWTHIVAEQDLGTPTNDRHVAAGLNAVAWATTYPDSCICVGELVDAVLDVGGRGEVPTWLAADWDAERW